MIIDLRSDTITLPTREMKEAMFSAKLGDDVFGEDPSVAELEEKLAKMFGKDSAVFCPSGTMTNQLALKALTNPYEEVICYEGSHVYKYEGGGLSGSSGLSVKTVKAERGIIKVADLENTINPDDQHYPVSSVLSLENTVNKGAGSVYTLSDIEPLYKFAKKNNLKFHLDGARIFNALIETGDDPEGYGKYFDTISVCLSKGLGAPVGSVLLCDKELEKKIRRYRKVFGGGMRQAGILAAAGIYALENHIERLADDHKRARLLGAKLIDQRWVKRVHPVNTNIIIFEIREDLETVKVLEELESFEIKSVQFGPKEIRWVTHLDFTDTLLEETLKRIGKIDL